MENSNIILAWTEQLKAEIASSTFHADDIRTDYLGMQYDIVYNFYKGNFVFDFSELVNAKKIGFSTDTKEYKPHLDRLSETTTHPGLYGTYRNWLVRALVISTWSNFELCSSTLCDAIINEEERLKLYRHQYSDVLKSLKNSSIAAADIEGLENSLTKHHLTHVPVIRKTDVLFNKANGYQRDTNADKRFLAFFGKLRNTMHTNFIYYGNKYPDFKFRDTVFKFENGEIVKWSDPYKYFSELYLALIDELKSIWTELARSIKHDDFIPYPAHGQD